MCDKDMPDRYDKDMYLYDMHGEDMCDLYDKDIYDKRQHKWQRVNDVSPLQGKPAQARYNAGRLGPLHTKETSFGRPHIQASRAPVYMDPQNQKPLNPKALER